MIGETAIAPGTARRWSALAPWAALAVACLWFLGDFGDYALHHDLSEQDESAYLRLALDAHGPSNLPATLAPLYCLWLLALHALSGDAITTYHLAGYLSSLLLPLVWFVLARSFRIAPLWAGVSALAWLVAAINLDTVRVGEFAAMIVWLTVMASRSATAPVRQWSIATSGLFIASFVRPELFAAALGMLVLAASDLRRRGEPLARALIPPLVIAATLIALFGVPAGGPRAAIAWHQHLARWIGQGEGLPVSQWGDDFDAFLTSRGLYSDGPWSFALAHPEMMIRLVLANVAELFFHRSWDTLAPALSLQQRSRGLVWLPLVASVLAGLVWQFRDRDRRASAPTHWPSVAILGLSALLALPICVLLFPWSRYTVPVWTALLLLLLPRESERGESVRADHAALIVIVLGLLLPRLTATEPKPKPIESVVRLLQARNGGVPIAIFSEFRHYADYLQPPGVHVGRIAVARGGFQAMLDRDTPSALVLTPTIDETLRDDAGYQAFIADPRQFGFACETLGASRTLCTAHTPRAASDQARRESPLRVIGAE